VSLAYYPRIGEILLCDYATGFVAPEMVKRRPVVVVSPRLRRRGELVGVVPLSTTEPQPVEKHHCLIQLDRPLPAPFSAPSMWAKCDMFATVSRARLDRFRLGRKGGQGSRMFVSGQLNVEQIRAIKISILCGLGLDSLTIHL
jgi:mRNA interferase MazF